ncbi:hypothetical protein A3C98_01415 [Candidatus Roizmanbacteria bacterium RIFCSPHIGHO2_02_FULL_37_15]|uniref:Uncharacterized protein n=1 Tax=Candidatus Roizmanbacteria bacterium RIFCSPLOWO2_01_FULL_37_16 TaxID=1802058 RepID=A0A1F7IQH2_9BACT|nr:MAG: hypothetical protein A2859_03230 [Candidatus Roizmanbacteria bacterium RIFCSPHIGHO2_01_FULL_37_16b]OGK21133.1 MAG: hypothetical protein A3C98_01415 [Candidatus Roizmanbacteria bacterium RIFCSPHIGHO2_02_FULL_37_15]OGK45611.1 MAG: hypothetical protein A3B40_00255 [Candidatus Roizmanbacteria bacterium RIFCSPLOWO2_01_FULL_37_16]OGK56653.1 MAG: hypothetical protein A3I50_01290 [Candidatus Roizmanbacteria bacterium RIFCSPLOWO2_02_FULL_37_9]
MSVSETVRGKVAEINSQLGIRFEHPHLDFLSPAQLLVNRMAHSIGTSAPQLQLPVMGFLTQPLTTEQRQQIDYQLGPVYAQESIEFQQMMMAISIEESGELMVPLEEKFKQLGVRVSFSEKPFHPASESGWAGKSRVFWTREAVSEKLLQAARALNEVGLIMHFEDAFRPVGVQEGLLKRRITDFILNDHPDWDPERDFNLIMTEAQSKTAIMPRIAGHKGGAAVDVTLRTLNGDPLPLGNKYPQGGALVSLSCPYLLAEEWQTRQIFRVAMEIVGMVVYPGEDWHASDGDNLAGVNPDGSLKPNYVASYGPITKFDLNTGKIFPYDPSDYDRLFFTPDQLRQLAINSKSKNE